MASEEIKKYSGNISKLLQEEYRFIHDVVETFIKDYDIHGGAACKINNYDNVIIESVYENVP